MAAPAPLLERLRALDWRITPQRRAVASVLTGEHVHLTADEVHQAAQHLVPELSLATVYNTLNELVEMLEVRAAQGPARYDPNVSPGHHHLVCRECGTIYDVAPSGLDGLGLSRSQRRGFAVDDVEITFRGLCPACAPGES
jgi:Fur family ferric uptake transcriptional regulator